MILMGKSICHIWVKVPVTAGIQPLVLSVVQINVGHFLPCLYEVRLTRRYVAQHRQCHLHISAGERQLRVGDGDSDFLWSALEIVDGILHYLGSFMLKLQIVR